MRLVYLDHNATTPIAPEVLESMKPYLTAEFGNASSIHAWGQRSKAAVEEARESVAHLLGAEPGEIVFTSGGTESDNMAVFGVVEATNPSSGVKHVVTSAIEHHAVLYPAHALEQRSVRVTFLPVGLEGVVDPGDVERAIKPETALISVMHANNEIGTLQPIEEIAAIARSHGITFLTDAVHSVGKIPVNVRALDVDLLSLSAHKLNGPKGVGALYIRRGTRLRPLMHGGHHERDRRPGTENVAGIVGLGKAAELALATRSEEALRLGVLRDRLEKGIGQKIPDVCVLGKVSPRLPTTSSIRFEGIDGEALVISMDLQGIACSTGAACSSGSLEPSHVLTAVGLSRQQARSVVRFSLGRGNTEEDIEYTLEVLPQVVERLRSLSPHYDTAMSESSR